MDRLPSGLAATLMQFILLTGAALNGYLVDIPNDGACFFTCLAYYALYCEQNSLPKPPVLSSDRNDVRHRLCDFLQMNQSSVMIADQVNQLTVNQYFLDTYSSNAFDRKAVVISSERFFVDTFEQYLALMRNLEAHADELFVWAASQMLNMQLSVLEKAVPRITDPNVKILVEMGYSEVSAINALKQASSDIEGAVTYLLQNLPSSESSDIWREDVHNPSGHFGCKVVRNGRHYQLVLPENVLREVQPMLPPRTRKVIVAAQAMWNNHVEGAAAAIPAQSAPSSRKSSASGGGSAAISHHQSSPSFGHFQPSQPIFDRPFVIQAVSLPVLVFSKPAGFFEYIAKIVQDSKTFPQCVEVTELSIPHGLNIALFGSFPVCNGDNFHPYRGSAFMFDDGSSIPYNNPVDSLSDPKNKKIFSEKVLKHWHDGNCVLTGIQFERCELKPIPRK